jgi:hypothetical protein
MHCVEPKIEPYAPLIWVMLFATSLFFHIRGGKLFWNFTSFLAAISILIVLIFGFDTFWLDRLPARKISGRCYKGYGMQGR